MYFPVESTVLEPPQLQSAAAKFVEPPPPPHTHKFIWPESSLIKVFFGSTETLWDWAFSRRRMLPSRKPLVIFPYIYTTMATTPWRLWSLACNSHQPWWIMCSGKDRWARMEQLWPGGIPFRCLNPHLEISPHFQLQTFVANTHPKYNTNKWKKITDFHKLVHPQVEKQNYCIHLNILAFSRA